MGYSSTPFATDEEVYRLTRGDYPLILDSSRVASGADGAFGVDGWTFESAAIALDAIGLEVGSVGRVRAPGAPESRWLPCAIDSIEDGVVTLRRPLTATGAGQPFGAISAGTTWAFEFYSASGTIGGASLDLRRRFRLESDSDLESNDDLASAAVYRACADLYLAASKEATSAERDTYFSKYKEFWTRYEAELKDLDSTYPGGVSAPGSEPVVFELEAGRYCEPFGPVGPYGRFF